MFVFAVKDEFTTKRTLNGISGPGTILPKVVPGFHILGTLHTAVKSLVQRRRVCHSLSPGLRFCMAQRTASLYRNSTNNLSPCGTCHVRECV